jgi:hypothetical protein
MDQAGLKGALASLVAVVPAFRGRFLDGRRNRLAAFAALASLLSLTTAKIGTSFAAPLDTFKTTYYDTGTSAAPSAAGYGGLGFSGGAGDNTVRIINTAAQTGTLCAMIYVFDDNEELQACCGCPITPDGLRTFSVVNDLTFHFGVNKGDLNAGVVEVVSALPNFNPFGAGNPPPAPAPNGTNGVCSPTGSFATDPFHRQTQIVPSPGLRAWITHNESQQPGGIVGGKVVQSASVDEFQDSVPDTLLLSNLQNLCSSLIFNGSGTGICTCGAGDDAVAVGSTRSR